MCRPRSILRSAAAGENPMAGLTPAVPAGATLTARTPAYREAEARGVQAAGACAFVLVAGGAGTSHRGALAA